MRKHIPTHGLWLSWTAAREANSIPRWWRLWKRQCRRSNIPGWQADERHKLTEPALANRLDVFGTKKESRNQVATLLLCAWLRLETGGNYQPGRRSARGQGNRRGGGLKQVAVMYAHHVQGVAPGLDPVEHVAAWIETDIGRLN